jgi:hypothetical protein
MSRVDRTQNPTTVLRKVTIARRDDGLYDGVRERDETGESIRGCQDIFEALSWVLCVLPDGPGKERLANELNLRSGEAIPTEIEHGKVDPSAGVSRTENAHLFQWRASNEVPLKDACVPHPYLSCMCSRGTKGCNYPHAGDRSDGATHVPEMATNVGGPPEPLWPPKVAGIRTVERTYEVVDPTGDPIAECRDRNIADVIYLAIQLVRDRADWRDVLLRRERGPHDLTPPVDFPCPSCNAQVREMARELTALRKVAEAADSLDHAWGFDTRDERQVAVLRALNEWRRMANPKNVNETNKKGNDT